MSTTEHTHRGPLLAWQWGLYEGNHADRANLLLHVVTVPVFQLGTLALASSLVTAATAGPRAAMVSALSGLFAMVFAMAVQGRGHKNERVAPVPFEGAVDVAARIFAEQWITFPRFVLAGGFARAWRASR